MGKSNEKKYRSTKKCIVIKGRNKMINFKKVIAEEIYFADSKKDNEEKENYDNLYEDMIINDDNEDDLPF